MKIAIFLIGILFFSFISAEIKFNLVHQTKIKITYPDGDDPIIKNGIKDALEILKRDDFYTKISEKQDFTFTSERPKHLSQMIKDATISIRVRMYDGGENTATLAYVTSDYPNTIFINKGKTGRSRASIANTIIHEVIHSIDRSNQDARFGHGGNSSEGKKESAPYWIGQLAENLLNRDSFVKNYKVNYELSKNTNDPSLSLWYNDGLRHVEETEELEESMILD